jgi:gluconokinase
LALSRVGEASARGAALLALEAIGALEDIYAAPPYIGDPIVPDEGRHRRYRVAMNRQQRLYARLITGSDP